MVRSYRGRWEIVLDVLEAIQGGAKKTHIMHRANLNHMRVSRLLDYLLTRGLIAEDEDPDGGVLYRLTEEGRSTLKAGWVWRMNLSKRSEPS